MNPFNEYIDTLQSAHIESEFHNYQKAFNNYKRIIVLGNGGFFLTFSETDTLKIPFESVKIGVESNGVYGRIV